MATTVGTKSALDRMAEIEARVVQRPDTEGRPRFVVQSRSHGTPCVWEDVGKYVSMENAIKHAKSLMEPDRVVWP